MMKRVLVGAGFVYINVVPEGRFVEAMGAVCCTPPVEAAHAPPDVAGCQ